MVQYRKIMPKETFSITYCLESTLKVYYIQIFLFNYNSCIMFEDGVLLILDYEYMSVGI